MMRWIIAFVFLLQFAATGLQAQEPNARPSEPRPGSTARPMDLLAESPAVQPTAAGSITNDDLVSFLNEDPEPASRPAPVTAQADSMLWKLVAVLCFILMFCAFLAIRHGHAKAGLTNLGPGQLSLVASLPLANRSVLHLVSASGSMLVVASDNTGVKSLVRLPEQFDDLVDAAQQSFPNNEVRHA